LSTAAGANPDADAAAASDSLIDRDDIRASASIAAAMSAYEQQGYDADM
jgi:hypothetical protein